jgi:hypothetical protein
MARGAGRRLVLLGVLLVAAGGLWFFRGLIPGPWNRPVVHTEVSEEAAASADEKLGRLRADGDTVRLSGVEFTSYVRYRMAERFSLDLETPVVTFEGATIRVDGRVPKERIPVGQLPRAARSFVPDTADVAVSGTLRTVGPGRAALRVESASFVRMPVPREQYLTLLDRVAPDEPGVADDELAFQLPSGVGAARVENGSLVLVPGRR